MEYTYDAQAFRAVFEREFTWLNGFMRNVRRFSQKTALIEPFSGKHWSYGQLNDDCNRLAHALRALGVGRGDVVLYQLLNTPEFALCYLAPQKLGAVNSPANYHLAAGETAQLLEHHRPKAYFYDLEFAATAQRALALSGWKPDAVVAVCSRGEVPALPEGHILFEDFLSQATCEPELSPPVGMYDETTRLYTSGTTGLPKAIPLNGANEVLSAHDVMMHFPLSATDVTMNMTPWFHRGGLHSGGLTPTWYAGGCVVALRMFSAKTALEFADQYGVTFLIGVPSVLQSLAARQERHPSDLSRLRGIVTMGSPLEREACIRFQKVLTPNIFNGYGTTETFWNSFLRPDDLPRLAGSAGRACTDDDVRVVRVYDDHPAAPDDTVPTDGKTAGEIILKSWAKSAMSYLDNPELTRERYHDGWFYTHDLGTWDEGQYVSICGRKDDMLISKGENIYPTQIEEVVCGCPGVQDCIVTGVPDAARGEAVAAYVIRADESLTAQQLNRFCVQSQALSDYKLPRYYRFVSELPYSATGKKLHYKLRAHAAEDLQNGLLKRP